MSAETITCPRCGETISCPGCETVRQLRRGQETHMVSIDSYRNEVIRLRDSLANLEAQVRLYGPRKDC